MQRAVSGTLNKFNLIWGHSLVSIYYFCMHLLATSWIYGIGKGSILKKFKDNVGLRQAAIIFNDPNSTHSQVQDAGKKHLLQSMVERGLKI